MSEKNTEDIDSLQLITSLIHFIKKRKFLILSFLILGFIFGLYKQVISPKGSEEYLKSFTICLTEKEYDIVADLLGNINLQLTNENYDAAKLAQKFGVSRTTIDKLINVQRATHKKESGRLHVSISVTDKLAIDSLMNGVITYLNSNPYIKAVNQLEMEQRKEFIAAIDTQLNKIDNKKIHNDRGSENVNVVDIASYLSLKAEVPVYLSLYEKKQNLEKENKISGFLILDRDIPEVKERGVLKVFAKTLLYTIVGFVIGLIFSLTLNVIDKIKKRL